MDDAPLPSIFELTPLNPTYRADPHVLLDDLRARCPVRHDPTSGGIILTRYEDIRGLVSDRTLWRDPLRADPATQLQRMPPPPEGVPRSETGSILTLDDPDHARIRQPLTQAFYARVAAFRPRAEAIIEQA